MTAIRLDPASRGFGATKGPSLPYLSLRTLRIALGNLSCLSFGVYTSNLMGRKLGMLVSRPILGSRAAVVTYLALAALFVHEFINRHPPACAFKLPPAAVPAGTVAEGCSALLTRKTEESTEWKHLILAAAEQSIEVSGNYCSGAPFHRSLELIRERLGAKPQLRARILANFEVLQYADWGMLRTLKRDFPARFDYLITHQKIELAERFRCVDNHIKVVIVDEKYFVTGGSNLWNVLGTEGKGPESRVLPQGSRDMDVVGSGPIAQSMRVEFYKLYAIWRYKMQRWGKRRLSFDYFPLDPTQSLASCDALESHPRLQRAVPIKLSVSDPSSGVNDCTEEYRRVLLETKKTLSVGNMLIAPPKRLKGALRQVSSSDVAVDLISNGARTNVMDTSLTLQNRHYYRLSLPDLTSPTLRIFEYNRQRGVLYHRKALVSDGRVVIVGTYNLGKKSHHSDYEWILTLESELLARDLQAILEEDMTHCNELSREEVAATSRVDSLMARIVYGLLWRFA